MPVRNERLVRIFGTSFRASEKPSLNDEVRGDHRGVRHVVEERRLHRHASRGRFPFLDVRHFLDQVVVRRLVQLYQSFLAKVEERVYQHRLTDLERGSFLVFRESRRIAHLPVHPYAVASEYFLHSVADSRNVHDVVPPVGREFVRIRPVTRVRLHVRAYHSPIVLRLLLPFVLVRVRYESGKHYRRLPVRHVYERVSGTVAFARRVHTQNERVLFQIHWREFVAPRDAEQFVTDLSPFVEVLAPYGRLVLVRHDFRALLRVQQGVLVRGNLVVASFGFPLLYLHHRVVHEPGALASGGSYQDHLPSRRRHGRL